MNEFLIELQAKLDETRSKENVSDDIDKIQSQLDKLKLQAEIDPKTISDLVKQLEDILNQKIKISGIDVDATQVVKSVKQVGKQISDSLNKEMNTASSATNKILRNFNELNAVKRQFVDGHDLISKDDISDAEKFYDTVRKAFSEFGQVTVSKGEILDGALESMRVKIEQVNDEAKITRDFMLYLNKADDFGNNFKLADDDTIRSTEKMIQHLNEEKNIINATSEEANAIKETLAEQEKYYEKLGQATKEQIALEKQRITAGEKQLEIINAQSKRRDSRISYNEDQIDKKGLSDTSKQREINDLIYAGKEKTDISFAKEIDKNLSSLSKLKVKWQEQGVYVDEFKAKVENLENTLNELSIGDIKGLNNLKKQLSSLSEEANIHKIQLSIGDNGDITSKINVIRDSFTKLGLSADNVSAKMNGVDTEIKELKSLLNSDAGNTAVKTQFDKLQAVLKDTQNDLKTTRSEYSLLISAQQRLSKASEIEAWNQKNSRATRQVRAANEAYIASLRDLNSQMTKMQFNDIVNGFKQTEISMRSINRLGASLKDQWAQATQSFTQWLSISSGIMTLLYQLQKIPKEVIKINSAMVELNKVSNASDFDIKKYFDEAAVSAKNLGTSVSDLISATADWSRLGYNLPDSKNLAEIASLYKNVGDGIDINTANESLVSTLQGFKLEANEAMHIIDAFNEVGNNFAIGSDGIGDALRRSASSMYAAGNTLEETIGLVTAANTVVQDPDSIGTAYKTVSMRIRGAKTEMEELGLETDGMVESTAKLQKEILALSGVDIMKDKDTFKSTYQILDELATKWKNLTDIQQASITELIAGKRQGNIISALMTSFKIARQATDTAINSTGSALKEQEKYEQGIQYSLDRLEASFQTFANHLLDSNFLKGIVDLGNGTISVIDTVTDKLGALGTIGTIGGAYLGAKGLG